MFKKPLVYLALTALASVVGCGSTTTSNSPGGRPDTSSGNKQTFTIKAWHGSITLKLGETKETDIAISRGKDFTDTVAFKISDDKTGLTFDPAEPKIDTGNDKITVKIGAKGDAQEGVHTITVTGTPSKGGDSTSAKFEVKVEKK